MIILSNSQITHFLIRW